MVSRFASDRPHMHAVAFECLRLVVQQNMSRYEGLRELPVMPRINRCIFIAAELIGWQCLIHSESSRVCEVKIEHHDVHKKVLSQVIPPRWSSQRVIRQISYTNFNLLRRRRRNKKKGVDSTVDSVVRPPAIQDQRRSLESKRRAHEQHLAAVRSKL